MSDARTLANFIGARLLPFTNPRVVCPPGQPTQQGRPNILVATPKRSGTHVLIDILLNNIPAYRNTPLYIDLDQCWKQGTDHNDLLGRISPDMGYVLKTHFPVGLPKSAKADARFLKIIDHAQVLTVRRNHADVARSMSRWAGANKRATPHYETEYKEFWGFWQERSQVVIAFEDLFQPDIMTGYLDDICHHTETKRAAQFVRPTDARLRRRIYLNKTLTRLVGRRAPHVDTTIHTLKE